MNPSRDDLLKNDVIEFIPCADSTGNAYYPTTNSFGCTSEYPCDYHHVFPDCGTCAGCGHNPANTAKQSHILIYYSKEAGKKIIEDCPVPGNKIKVGSTKCQQCMNFMHMFRNAVACSYDPSAIFKG